MHSCFNNACTKYKIQTLYHRSEDPAGSSLFPLLSHLQAVTRPPWHILPPIPWPHCALSLLRGAGPWCFLALEWPSRQCFQDPLFLTPYNFPYLELLCGDLPHPLCLIGVPGTTSGPCLFITPILVDSWLLLRLLLSMRTEPCLVTSKCVPTGEREVGAQSVLTEQMR